MNRDSKIKQDTVKAILAHVDYVGTVTASGINKVIFNSESVAYADVKVTPILEALVMVGQLNKCVTAINTFYSKV